MLALAQRTERDRRVNQVVVAQTVESDRQVVDLGLNPGNDPMKGGITENEIGVLRHFRAGDCIHLPIDLLLRLSQVLSKFFFCFLFNYLL